MPHRDDRVLAFSGIPAAARILDHLTLEDTAGELADGHALEEACFGDGDHRATQA